MYRKTQLHLRVLQHPDLLPTQSPGGDKGDPLGTSTPEGVGPSHRMAGYHSVGSFHSSRHRVGCRVSLGPSPEASNPSGQIRATVQVPDLGKGLSQSS